MIFVKFFASYIPLRLNQFGRQPATKPARKWFDVNLFGTRKEKNSGQLNTKIGVGVDRRLRLSLSSCSAKLC